MTSLPFRQRRATIWIVFGVVALLAVVAIALAVSLLKNLPTGMNSSASPIPSSLASEPPRPSTTPPASFSASSTPEPTATATPTPGFEAPTGILPPNSLVVVIVDALQVREQPGLTAAVVGTLPADTVVELSLGWIGPIAVDGIDWYPVVYYGDLGGYVAAGANGDRYLELAPPRCDEGEPDLAAVVLITEWERLACFGDRSLTVTGTYGCPVCGIAYPRGGYEPRWLASPDNLNYLGFGGGDGLRPGALILHFAPEAGLDAPPNASILRVTGHFSDAASSTCVIRPTMEGVEIGAEVDPAIAELHCREQFVVDAYEIIGTDPDFTYPTGS